MKKLIKKGMILFIGSTLLTASVENGSDVYYSSGGAHAANTYQSDMTGYNRDYQPAKSQPQQYASDKPTRPQAQYSSDQAQGSGYSSS